MVLLKVETIVDSVVHECGERFIFKSRSQLEFIAKFMVNGDFMKTFFDSNLKS